MKRTYHVYTQLTEHVFCLGTFDRLWRASKFSQAFEDLHCLSLIIDATALTDAKS